MTARDVLDAIKKNLGSPWNESTYRDVFHAGDPSVEVTGIATTFMATLDLLQRAHAAGMNLVIPHETTFWNDRDDTKGMESDAVYRFKVDFCTKNQMAVLRLHDHAHSHRPDFIMTGLLRALGWSAASASGQNPRIYTFPATTLGELAANIQHRTGSKAFRVVGDPKAKVSTGTAGMGYNMGQFSADVDVVIIGENPETGNASRIGRRLCGNRVVAVRLPDSGCWVPVCQHHPVEPKQQDRAESRNDKSRALIWSVQAKQPAQKAAHQRPRNAQQHGHDNPARIASRHD
jgi:putative NIF3 family GTP cyclohydrolase 1 type 2